MVLCKFFQQGSCRFGSKCHNEHFDVKQLIKTDVESAINGKQWPLSCFGPFKDKPCIPNFIDDQSFEEVRYLCYDSKQKNYFQQFHQQFTKEALEATNKMKTLMQMTPEVFDVISKIYDNNADSTSNANNNNAQLNNPFGMQSSNPQASSIFAKSNTTGSTAAGNIFGGGFQNNNTTTAGNIFGGGSNNSNMQQSSIFGGGGTTTGFNATAVPTQQQGTLFSQAALQQQQQSSSIFGGNVPQQKSIFGQVANPAAGSTPFTAPATTQPSSIFGQQVPVQQPAAVQNSFDMFTRNTQQNTLLFGQQQPTAPTTITNPFGQMAAQSQIQQMQPGAGLFAQPQQQATGLFGQAMQAQQQPTGLFGNVAPPAQQQQQQLQDSQNMFAQMQQNSGGIGGDGTMFAQAAMQQQQTVLQQTQQQQVLGPNQLPAQSNQNSSQLYSRMEDLTNDEIEAFKADFFSVGKLPLSLPPRELC